MPLPERIQNAPELTLGLELYFNGFLELSSERSVGSGVGPIPFTSIIGYCDIYGIVGEQREDFLWIISRLDHKYLVWKASKLGSGDGKSSGVQPADGNPRRDGNDQS